MSDMHSVIYLIIWNRKCLELWLNGSVVASGIVFSGLYIQNFDFKTDPPFLFHEYRKTECQ